MADEYVVDLEMVRKRLPLIFMIAFLRESKFMESIVRCDGCRYAHSEDGALYCTGVMGCGGTEPDGFCKWGEPSE